MSRKERIIFIVGLTFLILCLAAGTAADAVKASAPYHCGTMCKIKDKTTLSWRDLDDSGNKRDSSYYQSESQTKTIDGVKVYIPSQYQEDQAHEWAESNRQYEDEKNDDSGLGIRKTFQCLQYQIEYIGRHGTTTPEPLRHLRGCDKWTHDHWYWVRRSQLLNLMK